MALVLKRTTGLKRIVVVYLNCLGQQEVLCDEQGQQINFARKPGRRPLERNTSWQTRVRRAEGVAGIVSKIENETFGVKTTQIDSPHFIFDSLGNAIQGTVNAYRAQDGTYRVGPR